MSRYSWISLCFVLVLSGLRAIAGEGRLESAIGPGFSYSRAQHLMKTRNWIEASRLLKELRKEEPGSIRINTDLADALVYLGNREEALVGLNQLLPQVSQPRRKGLIKRIRIISRIFLSNKTFQSYQDGVNLLQNKKYRNARDRFEKALSDEPDNIEILIRLAQSMILDNSPENSVHYLQLASQLNPFESEQHFWMAKAYYLSNRFKEAAKETQVAYGQVDSLGRLKESSQEFVIDPTQKPTELRNEILRLQQQIDARVKAFKPTAEQGA